MIKHCSISTSSKVVISFKHNISWETKSFQFKYRLTIYIIIAVLHCFMETSSNVAVYFRNNIIAERREKKIILNISSQFQDVYINFSLSISLENIKTNSIFLIKLKRKNFYFWEIFIIKLRTVFIRWNNWNFLFISKIGID